MPSTAPLSTGPSEMINSRLCARTGGSRKFNFFEFAAILAQIGEGLNFALK